MSYSLDFTPEFFLAEGEPYDRATHAVNAEGQPLSLWSAIDMRLASKSFREDMAAELNCSPEHVTTDACYDRAIAVNTCGSLSTPVNVYLDNEGYITVDVYE